MNLHFRSNPLAAPACLPSDKKHPAHGSRCWTAGWGVTESMNGSTILQEVDVEIIDDDTCLKTELSTIDKIYLMIDKMFCSGNLEDKKGACQVIKQL